MKTTIEIPDELLDQVRQVARHEGGNLRRMVEEGLQCSLEARRKRPHQAFDFPTFGGSGLTSDFTDASWSQIRDTIYRESA